MQTFDQLIDAYRITAEYHFVPLSHSRNANYKRPCINWCYRLLFDGRLVYRGEYCAGPDIGREPINVKLSNAERDELCETGRTLACAFGSGFTSVKAVSPTAAALLECLLRDAEGAGTTFDDWASDYGYDNDSIKALRIYEECVRIDAALDRVIGAEKLAALRAALDTAGAHDA